MRKFVLSSLLVLSVLGGNVLGNSSRVTAQFGEETADGRRLFVYAARSLRSIELQEAGSQEWKSMESYEVQDTYHPYGSTELVDAEKGQEFSIRGTIAGEVRFVHKLVVVEDKAGDLSVKVEAVSEEPAPLTHQEMLYGAHDLHPQVIAQTRVNYMAKHGLSGHMGSGVIRTMFGTLCEGWGMGSSSQPQTCVGNGAPLADATCKTAGGMTHRIRFYRGGTWSPGGGGGSRGFGRRR